MLTFREAKKKDLETIADIYTNSFLDYDFFRVIEPDPSKLPLFVRSIQTLGLRADLSRHQVFAIEDDGKIVAAMSVQMPDVKQPDVWEYIWNGALASGFRCGFGKIIRWLRMYRECDKPLEKLQGPVFYLETLAVRKGIQGKGYGGKALRDFLIPFVREHGGGTIAFITNSESNVHFYERNGFECFCHNFYERGAVRIPNWCFRYDAGKLPAGTSS